MNSFRFLNQDARDALNFDYLEADKKMMFILIVHAFFAIFVTSQYYDTHQIGVMGSMVLLSFMSIAYFALRGTLWFRLIAALAVMSFSALYIQQHLGRIEMHFHVFIGLAILTIYKDTLPMLFASIGIIVHHFVFNWLQSQQFELGGHPVMIFSYGCGIEYVYLHGVMVVAEAVVLSYIIHAQTDQFLKIIRTQKALDHSNTKLEALNLHLEEEVRLRTADLKISLDRQIELSEELKKAKEAADSANRLKSEFLANMSHEIRTPLNAVIGFSDLLEQRIREPKERGYLEAIKNGGKTLLTLINDILDLSKIEAGHMKIELHPLKMAPFIRDICMLFGESAKKKGLQLHYRIDDDVPEWVVADEIHIRQILLNLLSNALKFTHSGEVVLNLSVDGCMDGLCTLRMEVKDSGIGISPSDQTKIFDAFVQNEGQDTRQYGGTGLGLSICRKLAHLMDGEMEIESRLGEGSTFTLVLHNIEISAPLFIEEEYTSQTHTVTFQSSSILIVDDIADNRLLLREVLSVFPFSIEEASDGVKAIEKIHNHHFDLILMDIRMPNMDGWEAIRIIREELHLTLPVIAVTASVMKNDYIRIMETFDGVLEKPVNREALINALARFLPSMVTENQEEKVQTSVEASGEFRLIRDELYSLVPQTLSALQSGDIEQGREIGEKIQRLGNTSGCNSVSEYGQSLINGAESFDIQSIESLLKGYATQLERWESGI